MKKSDYFTSITVVVAFEIMLAACSESSAATATATATAAPMATPSRRPSESDDTLGEFHRGVRRDESVTIGRSRNGIASTISDGDQPEARSRGKAKDGAGADECDGSGATSRTYAYTTETLRELSSKVEATCGEGEGENFASILKEAIADEVGQTLKSARRATARLAAIRAKVERDYTRLNASLPRIESEMGEAFDQLDAILAAFEDKAKRSLDSAARQLENRYAFAADKISAANEGRRSRLERFEGAIVAQLRDVYGDANRLLAELESRLQNGGYDQQLAKAAEYLEREADNVSVELRESGREINAKTSDAIRKIMADAIARAESIREIAA